jgi:hypothetical protein
MKNMSRSEDLFAWILFIGLICILMARCKSPYEAVRNDTYRSVKERNLLAGPCAEEFPCRMGKDTIINKGVDSSDYYAALEAYTTMLDRYVASQDSVISLLKVIEAGSDADIDRDKVLQDILRHARKRDSADIIRNFLKWYKPAPIIQYNDRIQYMTDSAVLQSLHAEINACEDYQRLLQARVDAQKDWKLRFYIAVGIGSLLIILLIVYLINRLTKIRTLAAAKPPNPVSRPPTKT